MCKEVVLPKQIGGLTGEAKKTKRGVESGRKVFKPMGMV